MGEEKGKRRGRREMERRILAMQMIRGMAERIELLSVEKRRLQRDLIEVFQHLKGP